MLGNSSADLFAEVVRGLHEHLVQASKASDRLQRCYDRDVAAFRLGHGLPEAMALETLGIEPVLESRAPTEASVVTLDAACVAFSELHDSQLSIAQGRTSKVPAVGTTPMLQLRPCSGDAAPGDILDVCIEDVSDPAAKARRSSSRGRGYAGSTSLCDKAGSAYHLRTAWTELGADELKKCMPQFQPTVQFQPASNAAFAFTLSLTRARRNPQNLETNGGVEDRCMFDPNATPHLLWSLPAIIFVAYDTLMVPLQAFHTYLDDGDGIWAIELCIAIYWMMDIPISFRTGYFQGTVLEMRPKKVAQKYIQTWFVLDIVLVLMEWVGLFVSLLAHASVMRVTRITRIIRVARLLRLTKIPNVWKLIEDQINSNLLHLFFNVVKTIVVFLIFVHAITCAWYAIGTASSSGWTTYDEAARHDDSFIFWYFASSRWVLAQVNGRTDMDEKRNMGERLFTCIVAVVFAVVFMSIFTSTMTATMLQISELSAKSSAVHRSINEYLLYHRVSKSLVAIVKRQMVANKCITILRDDEEREKLVLLQLPEHLKYDLLYEIRVPVLAWHGFFREFDLAFPRVARHICTSAVTPVIAHSGEDIFDQGDPCSRMLFIHKGSLVYCQYSLAAPRPEGWSNADGEQPVRSSANSTGVAPVYAPPSRRSMMVRNSSGCKSPKLASQFSEVAERPGGREQLSEATRPEWKVRPGMWLSEGALWLEWENQGRLVADADSSLLAFDSGHLAQTLLAYRDAYAMFAIYARSFNEAHQRQERPSDVVKLRLVFESI